MIIPINLEVPPRVIDGHDIPVRREIDRFGDVARPPYPHSFILDTGNVCNLRCPFCQTGRNTPGVARGFMSRDTFDTIIEKIAPHAQFISMINWGEPFLNKDICYFFSRCEALGIRTHVDSNLNPGFWSPQEAEAVVNSGIDAILGSIDGTTQEAYSKYRVRGDLSMALHNLRLLHETRERLGRSKPFVGWLFYLNRFNQHQVEEARRMAAAIGVPVWFKLLTCDDPGWKSSYHAEPDHPDLAMPVWAGEVFLHNVPPSIMQNPLHPALKYACNQAFGYMVINWNGDVYPCCVVDGSKHRLGNLVSESLDDVWYGDEYRKSRSFLRNFGVRQAGGSVCETQACPVKQKFIGGPTLSAPQAR